MGRLFPSAEGTGLAARPGQRVRRSASALVGALPPRMGVDIPQRRPGARSPGTMEVGCEVRERHKQGVMPRESGASSLLVTGSPAGACPPASRRLDPRTGDDGPGSKWPPAFWRNEPEHTVRLRQGFGGHPPREVLARRSLGAGGWRNEPEEIGPLSPAIRLCTWVYRDCHIVHII